MVFKTLFYVVGAILWFIYNARDGWKKHQEARPVVKTSDLQPEPIKSNPSKPVSQTLKPQYKAVNQKQTVTGNKTIRTPLVPVQRISKSRKSESASIIPGFVEGGSTKVLFNEEELKRNLIDINVEKFPSEGQLIGDDLRGESMNWRRAVIINELLRPVYF